MNNPAIIPRPRAELAEWRALELESRILEAYALIWYHYNASLSDHKDIAVFTLSKNERVEMTDSTVTHPDGCRGECSEMVAELNDRHEHYRIGVKQREPADAYHIGIDCPNQWGEQHSIMQALIHCGDCYTDIRAAVDRLTETIKRICDDDIDAQWLTLPKKHKEATP